MPTRSMRQAHGFTNIRRLDATSCYLLDAAWYYQVGNIQ